jgi:hypothetical protein
MVVRISFLLAFCFYSVDGSSQVPLRVQNNFTFCFDTTKNFIRTKLKFNGYYVKSEPFLRPRYDIKSGITNYELDTLYSNIIFFSNGLFAREFQQLVCNKCSSTDDKMRYFYNFDSSLCNYNDLFYNSFRWGVYTIEDNLIKTQSLNRQIWPNPYWYLVEVWYLIDSNLAIRSVYAKDLIEGKELVNEKNSDNVHYFINASLKIPPYTWLQNEKWFWCDAKQYDAWRKQYDQWKMRNKNKK